MKIFKLLMLALIFGIGCSQTQLPLEIDITKGTPILLFTASPDTISQGEEVKLEWETDGDFVTIKPLVGAVSSKGDTTINLFTLGNIVFTATVVQDTFKVEASDSVFVKKIVQGDSLVLSFNVQEDTVYVNDPVNLNWASNGDKVKITGLPNDFNSSGTYVMFYDTPGTYILTATAFRDNSTVSKQDTVVIVNITQEPLVLSFSVQEDTVYVNDPVNLNWASNGDYVTISSRTFNRTFNSSGTYVIFYDTPGTYILTATTFRDNSTLSKQDTVVIVNFPQDPLVLSFSVQDSAYVNDPVNLSWESNGDKVKITGFFKDFPGTGVDVTSFDTPGAYILTATAFRDNLTISKNDTVIIVDLPFENPETQFFQNEAGVRADIIDNQEDLNVLRFEVEENGVYKLIARIEYSGNEQVNESFYIVIRDIVPQDANAGFHKVIPDDPNIGDEKVERLVGTYRLQTNIEYTVDVFHYIRIADNFPDFKNDGDFKVDSIHISQWTLIFIEQ